MAARPTCKVVLREKQGTDKGGARIYPKGCKVRTEIKPGNQVIKKDKAGRQKYKTKTQDRDSFIRAARAPGTLLAHTVRLLYDTGAQVTTMPQANATKLGYPPAYVQLHGVPGAMSGVVPGAVSHIRNVDMTFFLKVGRDHGGNNDWRRVHGQVAVSDDPQFNRNSNLLGVNHIKQLGASYKVKFV
jgi:hypothetical protein